MQTQLAAVALILRALSGATAVGEVFGGHPERLRVVLDTLASIAELPGDTAPAREALLAMVHRWVAERRPPSDAELNTLTEMRLDLDARIKAALARI
jgi:hypothetical protein